jgi:hypothetical protein
LHEFAQEEAQTIEIGAKLDLGSTARLNLARSRPTTRTCR